MPETRKGKVRHIGAWCLALIAFAFLAGCNGGSSTHSPRSHSAVPTRVAVQIPPFDQPPSTTATPVPVGVQPLILVTGPPTIYNPATCSVCYLYVGAKQYVSATGASVQLMQSDPSVSSGDNHSLVELAAESSDGQEIVEVGWVVAPDINGDSLSHLFVFHWVNGQASCYNKCGFVQVSQGFQAGDAVAVGSTGEYAINYSDGEWQISYDGNEIGYFPASLWDDDFTRIGFVQVFGEVSAASYSTCTQMGNGVFGSNSGSTQISNFSLQNSTVQPDLTPYTVNAMPSQYNFGAATPTGLSIGGPGSANDGSPSSLQCQSSG